MRNKTIVLLIGLAVMAGVTACSKKSDQVAAAAHTLYHCAMHPQIISDKPGECPICHMRLIPIENNNPQVPASGAVPDQATVHLAPGIDQQIGVAVTPAEMRDLSVPIRAAAKVAYDPQLYSAALEHQESLNFLMKAKAQGSTDLVEQAESTVHSSELRLRQMGLSDEQIEDIGKSSYNPADLILGSKKGSLWVYASVFDYDASLIRPGQEAELSSPSLPGKTYTGTVFAIDPVLSNDTRTLRVRIRIPQTDGSLRPEMYLSAVIHARLGKRLAVPVSAVMDTGTRQIAYVLTGPGTYEPREVQVGRRAEDYYEILKGLAEGEKVVTSANFLIDSESRIQAATQKAVGAQ